MRVRLSLALAETGLPHQNPLLPGSSLLPKNRLEKPDLEKTLGAQPPPGPAMLGCA